MQRLLSLFLACLLLLGAIAPPAAAFWPRPGPTPPASPP